MLILALTIANAQTEPTLSADNADQLITPNSLAGWQVPDTGRWSINGDTITGDTQGVTLDQSEWLYTNEEYDDFVFSIEVRLNGNPNSGIYFRSEIVDFTFRNEPTYEAPSGYEYDLAPNSNLNASIGDFFGRGSGFRFRADQTLVNSVFEPDGWNRITFRAEGDHIEYWMNGTLVNELIDTHPDRNATGLIGIQLHSGLIMSVELRNAFVQELNDDGSGNGGGTENTTFTPDPNKTYYIDAPFHNLRLAASGESEEPYTTSTDTTGDDVEWQFVDKGNGYWHIQRAEGGTNPRLRTDNSSSADMQPTAWSGTYTYYDFETGALDDTYFLTLPDAPANYKRLQIDRNGNVNMVGESNNGTWESFAITEAGDLSNTSGTLVHITKSNATAFALDGDGGAENGQNIYLWSENTNNVNQQWIEIDRGNGYYSYQKQGTEYCIDGNNGGANNQNVYLWQCAENNQNQHWQKVAMADGSFTLIKRNATGYALNSGDDGANGQNVDLYEVSNTAQNQQWYITPIGTAAKSVVDVSLANDVSIFPNPVSSITTVRGAANSTIRIYNLNGQEILLQEVLTDVEALDLSSLTTGIYYARVKGTQYTKVIKVIKE